MTRVRLIVVCLLALLWAAPAASAAPRPLVTAVTNAGPLFFGSGQAGAFERVRGAGARMAILYLHWKDVAHRGRPPDPTDPSSPAYDFPFFDRQVGLAKGAGLQPVVVLLDAPAWAERTSQGIDGTRSPDPVAFGQFAQAVAARYDGAHGHPRVRYYEAWNEPNSVYGLNPQFDARGGAVSIDLYRDLLNHAAAAVHSVRRDNLVIAGGTFPFAQAGKAVAPLRFLSELTSRRVEFDVWATHPYTTGNATHEASDPDSVSLGDLPEMRSALDVAAARGTVVHRGSIPFWVSEFGWDSRPPDPKGTPLSLLNRWAAEALYQGWRSGVTLFTWYQLVDDPFRGAGSTPFQGGLYFHCGALACTRPKSLLTAFRFPFVAYRAGDRVRVWGRTPGGVPARLAIQQQVGGRWRGVASVRSDHYGIFQGRPRRRGGGNLRARLPSGETSRAFSLRRPPDRPQTSPFG
jgi:hypothetical protein